MLWAKLLSVFLFTVFLLICCSNSACQISKVFNNIEGAFLLLSSLHKVCIVKSITVLLFATLFFHCVLSWAMHLNMLPWLCSSHSMKQNNWDYMRIITSLAKEVMFLVALVSLFVCLSVCLFVCLFVCLWTTLLKKLWTDWDEILWTGPE